MEVLQCDGCDFRADSYDDLKAHIQDVHTAFLQPTAVVEGNSGPPRSDSLTSLSQAEEVEDELNALKNEYGSPHERAGIHSYDSDSGHFSSPNQVIYNQPGSQSSKPANQFFQCKFCVRYFRSKTLLNEHSRKVHGFVGGALLSGGNPQSSQASKQSNYSILMHDGFGKVFSCQYCTYKSPRRARILKHQKMYHKSNLIDSSGSAAEAISESSSIALSSQEPSSDLPEEVVERSILESMVKPLTKSRGNFSCEWCGYQTLRRERWCDHMMKKHRNMVKIISSLRHHQDGGNVSSSKSDSPASSRTTPNSSFMPKSLSGNEGSSPNITSIRGASGNSMLRSSPGHSSKFASFQYSQMKSKTTNSAGSSIMTERSAFGISDLPNTSIDIETNSILNDSRSSSDEDLAEMDGSNHVNSSSVESSAKQLLSEEDNKMLETKGIPFRRYMNRFQCPFCSFLTMHRRSISRHIENIHLSGKTTVYKCDECPFICTSPLKLGTHKQSHIGTASEWETVNISSETLGILNEGTEPTNGGNASSKVNGKKFNMLSELNQPNPHRCTLCSFSTTTLKGLRVHQQHKHSYCDNLQAPSFEGSSNELQDSETETYSSPNYVQKTQTSILGFSSKKHLGSKSARKSINDLPLDLSPVKKRTRIDEIANNLQSKISQSKQQEDTVINLEDMDDEEEEENDVEIEMDEEKEETQAEQLIKNRTYNKSRHQMYLREAENSQQDSLSTKEKISLQQKFGSTDMTIELTISDEEDIEDDYGASSQSKDLHSHGDQESRDAFQDSIDYSEESGTLFYCKHCDYHNKSARSVSTHYQRMHPYIKFSFRYILDPDDHSAVYRCLECYVEYTNFDDLNQHYGEHHPEASNVLNFNQPDLVYRCRFCLYTSPNVRSLMPHYQRMHPTVKINNAMIFSSYVVDQPQKMTSESQTLREILNSGPKNFAASSPAARSSSQSSPVHKSLSKTQESSSETDSQKETTVNNVVVYDCDMCSFASPNMHSVLVHYQKKHPEQKASYFRIQKTMRVVSVDRSQTTTNSICDMTNPAPPKVSNPLPVEVEEEIYYCKHCVYSNRSVVGVLVHYQKRHPEIKVTAKYIKHAPPTPGLMKLMEELQIAPPKQFLNQFNNGVDVSSSSQSRSGGEKGEGEMMFFCQHCDYGNRTVKGVLIHYQKKHRDVKANADLVRRHTAVVRSQRERAQMSQSGTMSTSPSGSDPEKTRPLRALKCRHCSYSSPYVYALKKHLKKDHPTIKATAINILHWAYQDGILEAGYHCEWCIYSHAEPNGLLMHYQRRHPEHNVDYTYMATKLWAGPDTSSTQQVGSSETKHYQCRDCAFEACSIWDITNHYQAVHPWAIKGDESVLLDIIKGNNASEKVQTSMTEAHVSVASPFHRQPSEQDEESVEVSGASPEIITHLSFASTSISSNPYQCTVCLSEYNSLHGLLTHYGKKHPGMKVKAADFAQEADINPSSVYKCRHCPYVNSRIHGVLTHYQKRHPLVKVTAEDFADDIEQVIEVNDGDEKCKSQRQGYGAYRCKMCPYTHGTLEKLKIHYEKYHNQPASDMFKPSPSHFSVSKDDTLAECSAANLVEVQEVGEFIPALSQFPVDKSEKHTVFRCQLCKYFCSTRKGIARHYRIKHNNVRAQPEGKNNVFKCALCSYTNPIRKGLAAHYQKRHDIDAYYTHCLAASKTTTEKPNKVVVPVTSQSEGPALSEELRLAVERRKCSLCPFQAFSKKSIVSHYIKRHPGVFPKRQHSSKLGRYFTVVYEKEPEKNVTSEERKQTEEQPETEQEKDIEWLPFKCIKCFKLSFNTAELLCMHYTDYHSKDLKQDFTIMPSTTRSTDDHYQCAHCDIKIIGMIELSTHLINHNEEFQKRAKRQERRKQLMSRQKGNEQTESKAEKSDSSADRAPIGYRCNFCVEIHPTLRAICNHLRKHVQYGEVKEGHVKQEVGEMLVTPSEEGVANGGLVEAEMAEVEPVDGGSADTSAVAETRELEKGAEETTEIKERPAGGHACTQCDRVFMSMQGLRSHERSHSALAMFTREDKYSCQYCQFVSAFRHNLDRHVQSHHGHHKPFRCKFCSFKSAYMSRLKNHLHKSHAGENTYKCLSCSFSTMTISQLKEHSLKAHGEALTLPKLRAATQGAFRPQKHPQATEQTLIIPESDDSSYSEPPDVQQQLSHYQLAARSNSSASPTPLPSTTSEVKAEGLLTCEFCEFTSGYMQSLRRHYRDRHGGKKLFKCKDCSFFTCYKSAFTMHVEAGHATAPEEGPKDLRCPLCLYHTKYKSNMIDHIVLHREERVVPIEVCRSKLSRHLQGIVFRCDKCTFTCSSDESLQQHIEKHNELKPYKCQLCYYDSKQREELENHLRDEHKVSRNFELVGRVNLDQLETMKDKTESMSSTEEEEDDEEGDEENEDEEENEKTETKEAPGSPGSSFSVCSEKRFPCEFCGRTFTHSVEWERHVLRHGMTMGSSGRDPSIIQAIEATCKDTGPTLAKLEDKEDNHSSDPVEMERCYRPELAKVYTEKEQEREKPETKNNT
nr:PREDICTED: zinc finger protein 462 isoform X1 [Lepisosteus oculatus]XP_015192848.1 PREDICTED: zinc finger protein 462 isoform X1 [Lepisosteus oculatus]